MGRISEWNPPEENVEARGDRLLRDDDAGDDGGDDDEDDDNDPEADPLLAPGLAGRDDSRIELLGARRGFGRASAACAWLG
jgi:hypothetical protein